MTMLYISGSLINFICFILYVYDANNYSAILYFPPFVILDGSDF